MAKQRSNFFKIPVYKGAGIYAIMNREKMSVYIGQTTDINARAKQHDEQLTSKTHVNKALQQDADNGTKLNFIVLQRLPEDTKENELKLLEKLFMLDFVNSGFVLYNQTMNTRENLMVNIILEISKGYHISEIISDAYMLEYGKHYCYDIEVYKNRKAKRKN